MIKLLFLIFLNISASLTYANSLRVMTYNTMCDFCKGSNFFSYEKRAKALKDKIIYHQADLISLQEVRSASQVEQLKPNKNYGMITNESLFISYADPSILYNKNKLKLIETENFWLGPNKGNLSIGWKYALPRQVQWGLFQFKDSKQKFYFISSHFDNRLENLAGSSLQIQNFIKTKLDKSIPIIFAADTNMTVDMPEYKNLLGKSLKNTFSLKDSFQIIGNYKTDKDLCYLKKGKNFPECRVDHILISKSAKVKINNFSIDIKKNYSNKFPSDHRPVIINLTFLNE